MLHRDKTYINYTHTQEIDDTRDLRSGSVRFSGSPAEIDKNASQTMLANDRCRGVSVLPGKGFLARVSNLIRPTDILLATRWLVVTRQTRTVCHDGGLCEGG